MSLVTRFALALVHSVWAAATAIAAPGEKLGTVSFANSCAEAVQPQLQRAVALLHSFWWDEADKAFRDVLQRDPGCAIATWGIATVAIGNPFGAGASPKKAAGTAGDRARPRHRRRNGARAGLYRGDCRLLRGLRRTAAPGAAALAGRCLRGAGVAVPRG